MATTYYSPTSTFNKTAFDTAFKAKEDASSSLARAQKDRLNAQSKYQSSLSMGSVPSLYWKDQAAKTQAAENTARTQSTAANNTALGLSRNEAGEAWDAAQGMTAGVSDSLMNDPRIEAALTQLQKGTTEGPYSEAVQNQLISRNADASAQAEGVNAEELRNQLASRGMSSTDPGYQAALRQMTAGRQANNLAFAGDTRSNAALQNYGAQQQAAQSLANTKLNQYNSAAPGYNQAANMQANRQFSKGRTAFANTGTTY